MTYLHIGLKSRFLLHCMYVRFACVGCMCDVVIGWALFLQRDVRNVCVCGWASRPLPSSCVHWLGGDERAAGGKFGVGRSAVVLYDDIMLHLMQCASGAANTYCVRERAHRYVCVCACTRTRAFSVVCECVSPHLRVAHT